MATPAVPDTLLPTALKAGQPGHLAHHQALHAAINLLTQIIDAHKHNVDELITTGTRSSTTFLRGDAVWAVPAGGTGGGGSVALDTDGVPYYVGGGQPPPPPPPPVAGPALFDVSTFDSPTAVFA